MTPSQREPDRDLPAATATTVDVLEPRERVRSVVAARLFGDAVMPARIDRFELIRELGTGGMGTVYAAHDPDLDRAVALKVLARTGEDPAASRRLVREAQAMARLKHPNVVAVHQVGTHGEQVYVAMELVEGGTLAEWIRGGPRPWKDVLALLLPAGRGLAAAHAAGLVHRDFKPANVLIGGDGRALVSDFGLARAGADPGLGRPLDEAEATAELERPLLETPLTRTGALLGTPAYMAPEQFRGEMATARSDVFAFCVVMWEALFGRRPYTGATLAALITAFDERKIAPTPPNIRIPAALRRELLRGLSPRPADRHASMTELLAALERAGKPEAPRSLLVAGALVASLSALTAGSYLLTRPPPQQEFTPSLVEDPAQFLHRYHNGPPTSIEPQVVTRDAFTQAFATQETMSKHARVMTTVKDGVFGGLKIYGLRPDTPLVNFGLKNGDALIAVDDHPLTGPGSWDAAMQEAITDDDVTILLKRKGQPVPLAFKLTAK